MNFDFWGIIIAIAVFSFLIFIHELGHFLAARWAGVQVNEFALGMGPALFKKEHKGTVYALRAFPIGGFCAMEGEDSEGETENENAFGKKPVLKRIVIIVAGATMNLLLGFLVLTGLTMQQPLIGTNQIAQFHENSTSSQWLQVGDTINKINYHRVHTNNDVIYELVRDADGVMDIQVTRNGESILLEGVTFRMEEVQEGMQAIDMDFIFLGTPEKTVTGVLSHSLNWTQSLAKQIWGSLVDLVRGRYKINQLSGVVGVTSAIGEASKVGLRPLMVMVAFITINLGVFNLLPLPALDGGRLIFLLIELVARRPVNPKYEGLVHTVGLVLLMCLMIFVTFNDVLRLF
ncbi:site-2 protease family protein [Oscillospiraceae bacterium MB08-C2-2]|nr:site-2 protease family protein [Oscillospiraceae bacterium MB08-C2-2]